MKHGTLAVWIALGSALLGLLVMFSALLLSQRSKSADASSQPSSSQVGETAALSDGRNQPN